jgi:hypothetical protein
MNSLPWNSWGRYCLESDVASGARITSPNPDWKKSVWIPGSMRTVVDLAGGLTVRIEGQGRRSHRLSLSPPGKSPSADASNTGPDWRFNGEWGGSRGYEATVLTTGGAIYLNGDQNGKRRRGTFCFERRPRYYTASPFHRSTPRHV